METDFKFELTLLAAVFLNYLVLQFKFYQK